MSNWFEVLTWIAVGLALSGNWFVVKKRRVGFLAWLAADVIFIINDFQSEQWAQASLFCIYMGLAVWGFCAWGKDDDGGGI